MTNWYSIFYWLTVADSIKTNLGIIAIITLIITLISLIGLFLSTNALAQNQVDREQENVEAKEWRVWVKAWRTSFISALIICFITGFLWMFAPTKKDALIIIAGGAVGNFITQDTSARALPSDVMNLLRVKIKEEINEVSLKEALTNEKDTLKDKSKEELLQILKNKK